MLLYSVVDTEDGKNKYIPTAAPTSYVQESPTGLINGSNTSFTLTQAPLFQDSLLVFVDNAALAKTEFSLSGATLNLNNAPQTGQTVYVFYAATSLAVQEVPTGLVDGSNTVFTLSETPASANSLLVFVDNLIITKDNYTLNFVAKTITFTEAPPLGLNVYVFYLKI